MRQACKEEKEEVLRTRVKTHTGHHHQHHHYCCSLWSHYYYGKIATTQFSQRVFILLLY